MRVIFFGGLGDMGKRTVKELCFFPEIDQVIVAGRSRERFEAFLGEIEHGKDKIAFMLMDLNQHKNFFRLFKEYDLAVPPDLSINTNICLLQRPWRQVWIILVFATMLTRQSRFLS